jgi:hypothetical protein
MIGDGLDHEVGAIADVGCCAEKDRADADGQDVMVEAAIAEQEGDLGFLTGDLATAQGFGVV